MKADCSHTEFFDSVVGTHKAMGGFGGGYAVIGGNPMYPAGANPLLFREFVVYEKGHCYPEFLVTYIRQ